MAHGNCFTFVLFLFYCYNVGVPWGNGIHQYFGKLIMNRWNSSRGLALGAWPFNDSSGCEDDAPKAGSTKRIRPLNNAG